MITTLKISGMHCGSCKQLIEEVCKDVAGVTDCQVDVADGIAKITHDGTVSVDHLQKEIRALGKYVVEEQV